MLDTYEFIKAMKSVGFPEIHAETLVEQLKKSEETTLSNLASKQDIHELKRDMKEMETGIKRGMKEMELSIDNKLEKMKGEITAVRGEITLLKWMMGIVIAGIVSLMMKSFFV